MSAQQLIIRSFQRIFSAGFPRVSRYVMAARAHSSLWSRWPMSGCVSPSKRLQHPHTGAGLCLEKVGGRVNYLERLTSLLGKLGSVPRSRYLRL